MSVASSSERLMLDLINQERTSRGLDPLTLELRLNDASEDHTRWMDRTGNFSHTGAGGSNPGDRMRDADFNFTGNWTWGENIAFQSERGAPGIDDDVADLHTALMNSPGHRANILNPNFEVIGIGIEEGDGRGYDAVYVTQNFARTSAALQLDLPSGGENPPSENPPEENPPEENPPEENESNNQSIVGTNGNNNLIGGDGDDTISGQSGNDSLKGAEGDDDLSGDAGRDRLIGGKGDDDLKGGAGKDRLNGGSGNDTLDGGDGNDKLAGKSGVDVFVFSAGKDVVTDFTPELDGEVIDLSNVSTITGFGDLMNGGHIRQSSKHVIIDDLDGNTLKLANVSLSELGETDFIF